MMKTSTKLMVTGAASVLAAGLVAGGAYAATSSMAVGDAPGQVLQVSGVGPASAHASDAATAHASPNAKGLSGGTAARTAIAAATHATPRATATPHAAVAPHRTVSRVPPAPAQPVETHHAEPMSEPAHSSPDEHVSGH